MAPFRFRLHAVLDLWQRREDAALADLQRQSAAVARARDRYTQAQDSRDQAVTGGSHDREGDDWTWHRNWIVHLSAVVEAARDDVTRCELNEASARQRWQTARRDRRVIERLRDRAERRHALEERRREGKALDELAVMTGRFGQVKEQTW